MDVALSRDGEGMKVHIIASRQATTEQLRNDIVFLHDRIAELVAGPSGQTVTIVLQTKEPTHVQTLASDGGANGNPQPGSSGSQSSGSDQRPQSSGKEASASRARRHHAREDTRQALSAAATRIV